ncbi:MAG: regulatory protein FmdB family [Acidimicrobiales bacterium]|nr:regulatory protein FmdB family [Acidimicrobiales bacterium]
MPTYEYACKSCGEHVEVVQSFKDDPLTECPSCGGPLRKVFAPVGIVLKGSGFYKTDNRKSGSKGGTKKEKESAGDSGASSSKSSEKSSDSSSPKSDTKSDTKSDGKGKSESKSA